MPIFHEPLPEIRGPEAHVYAEASHGRLVLQRCGTCGAWISYPRVVCPACGAADRLEWHEVSGRGAVYTFTIVHRAGHAAFAKDVPYVVAMVELDEGVRLLSNVVDCPPEQVRIGLPVRVAFRDVAPGVGFPVFVPA